MVKTKEKLLWKVEPYKDIDKISNYSNIYIIDKDTIETRFEVSSRTSSCGSIQLMNLFVNKYHQRMDSGLSKEERKEIFDDIVNNYEDFNHFFFIDCEDGGLERFFGDLGFKKCWDYCNLNTENIVSIWSYNRFTEDEVTKIKEEESFEEDNSEDDW